MFEAIAFGHGTKPPPPRRRPRRQLPRPVGASAERPGARSTTSTSWAIDRRLSAAGDFLQFIRDAEAGVKTRGLFEGRGPLAILLLVLIGGLALNLTPCVLPMIPINLAIIGAGAQAGRAAAASCSARPTAARWPSSTACSASIVILTAGTFGTINASPWFNLGIAVLFVVLGLAMFDVLLIDFSRFSTALPPARRAAAASCWRSPWARWRRCSPAPASRRS